MKRLTKWMLPALLAGSLSQQAMASGVPVIDVAGLTQAIQQFQQMTMQYQQMIEQYNTLKDQLGNMQEQLQVQRDNLMAVTGENGYGSWGELPYDLESLDASLEQLMEDYGLEQSQAGLSDYAAHKRQEKLAPLLTQAGTTQQLLERSQQRYNTLKQLIRKVDDAPNLKAATDLQARIAGEQAMLTNELINITLQQRQYEYEQALAVQQEKDAPRYRLFEE